VKEFSIVAIGYLRTKPTSKYELPRQAVNSLTTDAFIELEPHNNFEQAIEDLIGFSHIWIVSYFEGNTFTKPRILTPLSREKKGTFATRSPHRPNPLGISVVPLIGIKGRKIFVGSNDLLNGTPILDVKPYLPHADAFPNATIGWMEGKMSTIFAVEIVENCKIHWEMFQKVSPSNYDYVVETLSKDPFPHSYRRIKELSENNFILSVKLWRITYSVNEKICIISDVDVASEYDIDQAKCQGYPTELFTEIEAFQQFVNRKKGD